MLSSKSIYQPRSSFRPLVVSMETSTCCAVNIKFQVAHIGHGCVHTGFIFLLQIRRLYQCAAVETARATLGILSAGSWRQHGYPDFTTGIKPVLNY